MTFSGMDGAGKSTQCERLGAELRSRGRCVVSFWIRPGYTPIMSALKRVARGAAQGRLPTPGDAAARERAFRRPWIRALWIAAAILELLFLLAIRIRWLRACGCVVLCDRYLPDALVDLELLFPGERIANRGLWKVLERHAIKPDCAFFLRLPEEVCRARSRAKNEPFPDGPETRAHRWQAYERLATSADWIELDARATDREVATHIRSRVHQFLGN